MQALHRKLDAVLVQILLIIVQKPIRAFERVRSPPTIFFRSAAADYVVTLHG